MLSAVVVVFLLSFGRGKRTLKSNSYENVNVFSGGPRKMCVCVYSVSLDLILLCLSFRGGTCFQDELE